MITYAIKPIFRIKHALVDYIILILVTYEPSYWCLTLHHPNRYPSLIDRITFYIFGDWHGTLYWAPYFSNYLHPLCNYSHTHSL